LIDAKEIASDLDVGPTFCKEKSIRSRRKKKTRFDYENSDEPMQDPETKFEFEFFSCILDAKLQSLEVRFLQLQQHNIQFRFLYSISSSRNMSKEHLMKHCVFLQALLTDKQTGEANIDGLQMME
jgi:hypothetical protein